MNFSSSTNIMHQVNPVFTKNSLIQIPCKCHTHIEYIPKENEKLNWVWYNPPAESVPVSFCMDTSLHGLKYLGEQKRHIFERLFWLIAFLASLVASVILIWGIWSDYRDMPIVTVFTPIKIKLDKIPFPGVTICTVNALQKSKFDHQMNEIIRNELKHGKNVSEGGKLKMSTSYLTELGKMLDMDQICSSTSSFTDKFVTNTSALKRFFEPFRQTIIGQEEELEMYYTNPLHTLRKVSLPCNKMILKCVWLKQVIDCDELFRSVETDYGHCCTFNSVPASLLLPKQQESISKDKDSKYVEKWRNANLNYENLLFNKETKNRSVPYRQRYPGRSAGLSILLDPDLDEYFCTHSDSEGYIMGINVPLDFPRMDDDGIAIQTNSEVFVGLKPEVTMSHESISRFPIDKRQCYYGNENKLPHYSTYTVSNCMDECVARKTEEQCNCKIYYMLQGHWEDKECKPSMYNCTDNVQRDIVENGLSESCSECLPTCTEIVYNKEITFLKLQKKKLEQVFDAFPSESHLKSYVDMNGSIVHIYFSEDSVHPKLRKEVTSLTGLLSNTGGLLGLCMGFSVLSLLEILYYGSLRLFCSFYRDKAIRNKNLDTELSSVVSSQPPDYFETQATMHPKQG